MSIQKRIEYFNWIRDIPYEIGLCGAQDYCCSTKSVMLAALLEGLNLKTRYIVCQFDWTKTPVPKRILALPYEQGETHQFLEVFIPESQKWVKCDPTWDIRLGKLGFEIAEWDGLNDTILAVDPVEIYSPEKTVALLKEYENPVLLKEHFDFNHEFYTAINEWLATARVLTTPEAKCLCG